MESLYQLTKEYQEFLEMLDEIPEEAIADTLEAMEGTIKVKADNIACVIKNLTAQLEAIKAEKKALAERAERKEKEIENLTKYLLDGLTAAGISQVESARNLIKVAKTPAKVVISSPESFIEWAESQEEELLRYAAPAPDKTKIKKYLEAGNVIPGVTLESGQTLRIK